MARIAQPGAVNIMAPAVPKDIAQAIDKLRGRISRAEIARQALEEWVARRLSELPASSSPQKGGGQCEK